MKWVLLILLLLISGCIDKNVDETQNLRTNPNLKVKIVNLEFDSEYIIAGEKVIAKLEIANLGNETIVNETVELKAKVKRLDDFLANLYLKTLSDEKKTQTFTIDFNVVIPPGKVETISALFNTKREMHGKSLAGEYEITINLYVNGEWTDSKVVPITLHPPRREKF